MACLFLLELQAAHLRTLTDGVALEFLHSNAQLTHVNFSHTTVGDETVADLGKSCPRIEVLHLKV